jgi:membrane-associated protease RseP (regulator of RpoE activity)
MRFSWLWLSLPGLLLVGPLFGEESLKKEGKSKKTEAKVYEVPYRLTDVKHVLIRAKINGKGPFNFILDTGAPALFVSTAVCKKLGIEPDKKGWGTFDKLEIEGGVVLSKARGRIEDPFQLEGMNSMGLAGAELHGVVGYNILARYRLEFDFTQDKMKWTPLDFVPKGPEGMGGRSGGPETDAMVGLLKLMAAFIGKKPMPILTPRGFVGIELTDSERGVGIKSVLAEGPAAKAGLQAGDEVTQVNGKAIKNAKDLRQQTAELKPGQSIKVTVRRGGESREITVNSGEGL